MTQDHRIHRAFVDGYQVEGHDVLCKVCLSFEMDEMVLSSVSHYRQDWRGVVISEHHSVLLAQCDSFQVQDHWVSCNGDPPEACCQVSNRYQVTIPAPFATVMLRYWDLPAKLRQESDAFMGRFQKDG
jgi:hypothetical protein